MLVPIRVSSSTNWAHSRQTFLRLHYHTIHTAWRSMLAWDFIDKLSQMIRHSTQSRGSSSVEFLLWLKIWWHEAVLPSIIIQSTQMNPDTIHKKTNYRSQFLESPLALVHLSAILNLEGKRVFQNNVRWTMLSSWTNRIKVSLYWQHVSWSQFDGDFSGFHT